MQTDNSDPSDPVMTVLTHSPRKDPRLPGGPAYKSNKDLFPSDVGGDMSCKCKDVDCSHCNGICKNPNPKGIGGRCVSCSDSMVKVDKSSGDKLKQTAQALVGSVINLAGTKRAEQIEKIRSAIKGNTDLAEEFDQQLQSSGSKYNESSNIYASPQRANGKVAKEQSTRSWVIADATQGSRLYYAGNGEWDTSNPTTFSSKEEAEQEASKQGGKWRVERKGMMKSPLTSRDAKPRTQSGRKCTNCGMGLGKGEIKECLDCRYERGDPDAVEIVEAEVAEKSINKATNLQYNNHVYFTPDSEWNGATGSVIDVQGDMIEVLLDKEFQQEKGQHVIVPSTELKLTGQNIGSDREEHSGHELSSEDQEWVENIEGTPNRQRYMFILYYDGKEVDKIAADSEEEAENYFDKTWVLGDGEDWKIVAEAKEDKACGGVQMVGAPRGEGQMVQASMGEKRRKYSQQAAEGGIKRRDDRNVKDDEEADRDTSGSQARKERMEERQTRVPKRAAKSWCVKSKSAGKFFGKLKTKAEADVEAFDANEEGLEGAEDWEAMPLPEAPMPEIDTKGVDKLRKLGNDAIDAIAKVHDYALEIGKTDVLGHYRDAQAKVLEASAEALTKSMRRRRG